jgi:hypothetical protein
VRARGIGCGSGDRGDSGRLGARMSEGGDSTMAGACASLRSRGSSLSTLVCVGTRRSRDGLGVAGAQHDSAEKHDIRHAADLAQQLAARACRGSVPRPPPSSSSAS